MTTKICDTLFDITSLLPAEKEPHVPFNYPQIDTVHEPLQEACRDNLRVLAEELLSLPEGYRQFEMKYFQNYSRGARERVPEEVITEGCGTVGCAVGHGPTAGFAPLKGETWFRYTERVFLCEDVNANPGYRKFSFLFGGEWSSYDNTPQGAGRRIEYALQHGVPRVTERSWVNYLKKVDAQE